MTKSIIDYLLLYDLADIPQKERNELKQLLIGDKELRYNEDKPISKMRQVKLKQVRYRVCSYASKSSVPRWLGMLGVLVRCLDMIFLPCFLMK